MNTIDRLNGARYVVVLSACTKAASLSENAEAIKNLHHDILALSVKHDHAIGVYQGETETSLVTYPQDMYELLQVIGLGRKYNQECVLIVADNTAMMLYTTGQPVLIGTRWAQIPLADTYELDAYTYIDGHYFVIV